MRAVSARPLVWLLGLWGFVAFRLPDDCRPCRGSPRPSTKSRAEAVNRRVDLMVACHDVTAYAHSLKLTQVTLYVSMLQLAGLANNESVNPLNNAYTNTERAIPWAPQGLCLVIPYRGDRAAAVLCRAAPGRNSVASRDAVRATMVSERKRQSQ